MIYLEHKLQEEGMGILSNVYIAHDKHNWVVDQIRDEFKLLFPEIKVYSPSQRNDAPRQLDMIVIPILDNPSREDILTTEFNKDLWKGLRPNYFMLYDINSRLIDILPPNRFRSYVTKGKFSCALLQLLRLTQKYL